MKDKNYSSAIEAYSEALKIDPKHTKSLMNRSLAYLKCFNLDSSINDCDNVLQQMQGQIASNKEDGDEALMDIVKIKTRKAMCLGWKGKFKESKELFEEQLDISTLSESIRAELECCVLSIKQR